MFKDLSKINIGNHSFPKINLDNVKFLKFYIIILSINMISFNIDKYFSCDNE